MQNKIEISSSDDSDNELPLWKRIQQYGGKKSATATETLKYHSLLNRKTYEDVKKKNMFPATRFSRLDSQSMKLSGCSLMQGVSSSIQEHLEAQVSGRSDLSQVSGTSKGEKRKKRTLEEIRSAKEGALERRAEMERQREEQTKKREGKMKEKQREQRKALREAHKALRPEECLKHMTVSVDQSLVEGNYGALILQKLQGLDCRVAIIPQQIAGAISWSRQQMELNLGHDLQLDNLEKRIEESEALVVIKMADFVNLVYTTIQQRVSGALDGEALVVHAQRCMQFLGGKMVTYIVPGVEQYFRNSKARQQRNNQRAVLGGNAENSKRKKGKKVSAGSGDNLPDVSRVQMEESLVDLQLQHGCSVRCCETPEAVSDFIAMFTKAVAEKPFKKQRDKTTFSFHVNSEWAGGVKVAKDGQGLIKVWKQQLQQFRNVSPEMANAIMTQYPSPQLLLQGYRRCTSIKESEMLLQDIVIRRGEGVLATSRRVGPELSRRVYKQMTSIDGNVLI